MKLLVIIDMQNDFISGSLGSIDAQNIVENVVREIKYGDYDHVILTRDTHYDNYLDTLEGKNLPVKHCIFDTDGWMINENIYSAINERRINYSIYDKETFECEEFINDLKTEFNDIEEVTITGLCTDICVISNALAIRGCLPNTKVSYIKDATAGVDERRKEAALIIMEANQIYEKEKAFNAKKRIR